MKSKFYRDFNTIYSSIINIITQYIVYIEREDTRYEEADQNECF